MDLAKHLDETITKKTKPSARWEKGEEKGKDMRDKLAVASYVATVRPGSSTGEHVLLRSPWAIAQSSNLIG